MDDEAKTLRIRPFDGTGFNNWCFRMRAYLQQLDVLHCVEKEPEDEDFWHIPDTAGEDEKKNKKVQQAARIKQDNKCRSVLIQAIADSHLEYVKDKVSPKQIWDGLHDVFERKSITNRFMLKRQLLSMRYDERERLQEHFLKFDQLVREIKGAGARMEEEDVICHLMLTMPESYDAVTTAMEAVSENLTLDMVRRKYLDVEAKRRGQRQEVEKEETAFSGKQNTGTTSRVKCFGCGGLGHKKAQCKKSEHSDAYRKSEKKKPVKEKAHISAKTVSFVAAGGEIAAASTTKKSKWYLDSGASEHMTNDSSLFDDMEKLKTPVVVQTAKTGVVLLARQKGRIVTHSVVNNEKIQIRMEDVLYIPDLALNLLSLRRLESSGKKVTFYNGCVTVEVDGEVVATGRQSGRLYCMNFECEQKKTFQASEASAMISGKVPRKLELWHQRYGHLGSDNLAKLLSKNMVDGMKVDAIPNPLVNKLCEACIVGKQTREPFQCRSEKRANRPLEIVHSDVCGPVTPKTWDGNNYFVTFTDDYTHVSVVYLMRSKSEVLQCLEDYEAMASAHFGLKIGRLICDNGGEYTGKAFRKFCRTNGIRVETTVPYTPEQNGVSERLNRTIVEKVRAMLASSGMPKNMWGEAVYTAVYLLNRSPSVAVKRNVTPYEAWHGKKPNVANLRIFGSECYVHIPKQLRKKLDSKSEKVRLVGYAPSGYRVWNGKRVFVARDVIFNEEKLGHCSATEVFSEEEDNEIVIESRASDPRSDQNQQADKEDSDLEENDSEEESDSGDNSEQWHLADTNTEEVDGDVRRSGRSRVQPAWHKDYDLSATAFALCAEDYLENIPSDIEALRKRSDWNLWKSAIEEELASLAKNNTWTLVEQPTGRKLIDNKWVFKVKRNSDGEVERYKARLVARGFSQRPGFDFSETYSPVAKMSTLRILLALANQEGWHVHQMDVTCAFLNGVLDEDIYMRQPAGFERGNGLVCKLNKAIYGLKQASRSWNRRFHDFISGLGFNRSEHDFCLYYLLQNGVVMYVVIYVDDILIVSSSEKAIWTLKRRLSEEFEMKDLREVKCFLGLNIRRDREAGTMTIDQQAYVKSVLERFGMSDCKPSAIPMETRLKLEKEKDQKKRTDKPYRELVGCLMYLMVTSRPDLSAAVTYFASFQCCPTNEHWVHLKRVLRYLKGTADCKLEYKRSKSPLKLEAFADADWGNDLNDRKSISGFVIQLNGSTVMWTTRKQGSVALSTTEAELMALCQASCDVVWIRNLLKSIGQIVKQPITMFEDNQPCIAVTTDPRKHKRMKHIEIQHFFVRDLVDSGQIQLEYLSTEEQVADIMTKGLPSPRFCKLREKLGIIN